MTPRDESVGAAVEYAGGRTMLITVRPAERGARAADDRYFSMYGNYSCL
ncbi:hypothetical protein AB0L97_04730 [Nocardia sp. NPDC051911]